MEGSYSLPAVQYPRLRPHLEGDAPAAQESEPESAEPVTISYWAYGGFATPGGHGYAIIEAFREANPDINVRVLPIPVGLGASAL